MRSSVFGAMLPESSWKCSSTGRMGKHSLRGSSTQLMKTHGVITNGRACGIRGRCPGQGAKTVTLSGVLPGFQCDLGQLDGDELQFPRQ